MESILVVAFDLGHLLAEERTMLGRDGEVEVDGVVAHAGVLGTFHNVLFEGCALQVPVFVELEESLGQIAIAHVLLLEQEVDDGGEVAAVHIVAEVGLVLGHAAYEVVEEGKGSNIFKEFLDRRVLLLNLVVDAEIGGCKGVEVLEHAGGSPRGGHEFKDFLALRGCGVDGGVAVDFLVGEAENASIVDSGSLDKLGFGEPLAEVVNLVLYVDFGQTEAGDLLKILG